MALEHAFQAIETAEDVPRPTASEHLSVAGMHLWQAFVVCCRRNPSGRTEETREAQQDVKNHPCVINPTAVWKARWDLVVLVCILYSAVSVPVHIGFDRSAEGTLLQVEIAMSIVFVIDLLLSFLTAYISREGVMIYSHRRIFERYIQGWFWIDAPSSVPVELIEMIWHPDTSSFALLRFLRMFRLIRLLKLLKIASYASSPPIALIVSSAPRAPDAPRAPGIHGMLCTSKLHILHTAC